MNTFFLDQSVQKIFYIILKTEALVPAQVLLRCSSSNFSVHRTTAKHSFQSSIRYCMAPLYCSLYGAASDSVVPVLRDRGRESPTGQGGGRSMCARVLAVLLFSTQNKYFVGHFDPKNVLLDNEK